MLAASKILLVNVKKYFDLEWYENNDNTLNNPLSFQTATITRSNTMQIKSIADYKELAEHYVKVNHIEQSFPPVHLIKNKQMERLLKLFTSSNSQHKKMLIGYDFISHLKLFEDAVDHLNIDVNDVTHGNVLFVVDIENAVFYYVRLCEEETPSLLQKELNICDAFLKAFVMMHKETLEKSLTAVCTMVAVPTLSREEIPEKVPIINKDDPMILTKDEFENDSQLQITLNKILNAVKSLRKKHGKSVPKERKIFSERVKEVYNQSMATMALSSVHLPGWSKDNYEQITSILLNGEQYHAIHHPDLKRIIRASTGYFYYYYNLCFPYIHCLFTNLSALSHYQ